MGASAKPTGLPVPNGTEPVSRLGHAAGIPCAAKRWTRAELERLGSDKGFLPAAYWPLRLVIVESPYAGDVDANVAYARAAMRDSLNRGEAPIASHLLYTQPGILRDEVPEERQWGIDAGLAWREVAELAAFYVDRGWSAGMVAARATYESEGMPFEMRSLSDSDTRRMAETEGLGSETE
jgi:hypothetical protein